jgi:hypothetical protein
MNRFEKAALFGSMFGRKFTPDRKLQQALIAEREKLMDIWEEGGTDWSPETHPDMGGNPDFNRRWNKAFNEKKEVEPRVIKGIPYPLYGSKPSWFPFRTQGMIDKAREADYVRGDNEDAWDENDWKTERALQNDRTREGVNNILNHYLDRHHGIVKNPYRHPADLEYIDGPHADYKGIVQKSLPWNTTADTDKVNELADETMFPDYKSPANRQKLFDQYYPYLDLAPSAKPSKKGPIAKAAAFGAMMGKMAAGDSLGVTAGQTSLFSGDKPPPVSQPTDSFRGSPDVRTSPTNSRSDPYPDMPLRGGPHNPPGYQPNSSTSIMMPSPAIRPGMGSYGGPGRNAAQNALSWNYGFGGSMGYPRKSFHTDLTNQLNSVGKFDDWNKRMGTIADDMSKNAPIRHVEWPGAGYGPPKPDSFDLERTRKSVSHSGELESMPPQGFSHNVTTSWRQPPSGRPTDVPYAYSRPENDSEYPSSFSSTNNTRVHELTHAGYQPYHKMFDLNPPTRYTDKAGKPLNGEFLSPNDERTAKELGATWTEVAQGARAFGDVTGNHMKGTYNFAPGMDMDYRELADLAKKYKVGDINTPAGQKFMQQALRNSTPDTSIKPINLRGPGVIDFNEEGARNARTQEERLRAEYPPQKFGPSHSGTGFISYPTPIPISESPNPVYKGYSQRGGAYGYPYGPERLPPGYGN